MLENKLTVPLEQPPANNANIEPRQHQTTPTSNPAKHLAVWFAGLTKQPPVIGDLLFHSENFGVVAAASKPNPFSITTILFELRRDLGQILDFTIVA
jgi:hypothetical protein